jgi:DNA-binding beta-propeller fold protein YncE
MGDIPDSRVGFFINVGLHFANQANMGTITNRPVLAGGAELMQLNKVCLFLMCISLLLPTVGWARKATGSELAPALVWPMPPESPRIRYVGELYGSANYAKKKGRWRKFLVGEEQDPGLNLKKPYGVVTDSRGRMYVSDTGLGSVLIFDEHEKEVRILGSSSRVHLVTPIGLALDERERLFVSDVDLDQVFCFNIDEEVVLALGRSEGMKNPAGIAIDKQRHRLYVADSHLHQILVYSTDGQFLERWGDRGTDEDRFNFPTNVTVDRDGNVYVVDTGNFRVKILTPEGKLISQFGEVGDSPGSFHRPKGVAVDSAGHVYVADAAFNNFQIFDTEGQLLMYVGSAGRTAGTFWLPAGIHIDGQDRIYVVDQINKRIQIFDYLGAE